MPSKSSPTTRLPPSLKTKLQPAQQRATATFERILAAAALTLEELGIERFSTNLVCERAGVTPPALYRYFPNKYALLSELGKRLMEHQNERIGDWVSPDVLAAGPDAVEKALAGLLVDTYKLTRETPGGVWIMRALRAVPALQQVRLDSNTAVTEAQMGLLIDVLPMVPRGELRMTVRITVELIYAAVEMLFDEPLDPHQVARVVAGMIASHLQRLMGAAA